MPDIEKISPWLSAAEYDLALKRIAELARLQQLVDYERGQLTRLVRRAHNRRQLDPLYQAERRLSHAISTPQIATTAPPDRPTAKAGPVHASGIAKESKNQIKLKR